MKILVTGSSGLIGTQLTKDLLKTETIFSVYNTSIPTYGIPINLDITQDKQVSKVLEEINPDVIVHLAALTDVDKCQENYDLSYKINTKPCKIISKFAEKNNTFLIYVSTDYVFDGQHGLRKESHLTNPQTIYGKTKLEGENIIKNSKNPWCIIRTSTPFGVHSKKKSFLVWVTESLLAGKTIQIVDDQFTSPVYIPHFSEMLQEIISKKITGLFHLSGNTRISRYDLAVLLAQNLELNSKLIIPVKIADMNWKSSRPSDCSLDLAKISSLLENKPKDISETINLFISDLKKSKILQ
jgi:dTDP-4-dehydrorhamnose reductase